VAAREIRCYLATLGIAILGALGVASYVLASPIEAERFTEFYILGQEGKAADYPRELKVGEAAKVQMVIINYEYDEMHYRMEIRSEETPIEELGPVMLQHKQKWEKEVSIIAASVGKHQKVEFLLFKEGESKPYSSLHLWLDVKE